jgi:serine/threonine protein kinase
VQYSFGGAVACFYQYVSAGEGGDIEFHNSTFLNNAAFGVLSVVGNSDFRAGQGGAMSIIGVTSRRVLLFNVSFLGNFADSTGSQLVYSIGGAITLSQASKAFITLCKFLDNSAVGGFGNDIAIPTNSEDAVDILIEASDFYSPSFNITRTFLNVKQNLVNVISEAGYIPYFDIESDLSMAEISVDDKLSVLFPSPKDHLSSIFGFFVTSGRVVVNNVQFISRYHIFLGNFLNFLSNNELSKYVSNTTFEISGNIPDSQLLITAVSATVTVKLRNGSCLGRLNAINCTVVVDRDMCISGGSAITGSSFLAKMVDKPTIEFRGVVFHGAYYNNRFEFLTKESRLSFSGVNALVSGSMVIAESQNITKDVNVVLDDESNFIIGPRGSLILYSDTIFESSSKSNISSVINMGVISVINQPTEKTELVLTGSIMNQTYAGQLRVSLDNRYETQPILFLDNKVHFGGILNASIADGTKLELYAPQNPTSFNLLVLNNVEAPGDLNMTVITDMGLLFEQNSQYNPSKKIYNLSLTISEISCENVNKYYFVDPTMYADASSASNYLCHICLLNSSCGFCSEGGGGGCVYGDQCISGSMLRDNCCLGGCNGHGSCDANAYFSSFECVCDFFYTGEQCENLSLYSWLFVGLGVFVFFFMLVSLGYYYYYMKQPNRVLEDLLHQLSGDKTRKEVISATHLQRLQQEFILKDVFVKYEEIKIEDKIGEGSFGEVFKASFRGAQVALKKLRNPMFMQLTTDDIEEFRKEAYMMSRLRHPNIVLVMGISVVELETRRHVSVDMDDVAIDEESNGRKDNKAKKTLCILTEYLEQGSLADILYGPKRIPSEVWTYELVLICAIQAAKGMLYLHSQTPPICHRDLKSSNLVVDNHWVVKVTDFGMSRIVPESSAGENVNPGLERPSFFNQDLEMTSNLGTTAWCAPEIFTPSEKARYSLPVDVYSFGMVLWELWERKRPYEELPSRFDVIDAIKAGNRPVISDNCPTGLMSLIQRCWQYEPSRRPKFSYIVRYLKEELARVQRQRNAGVASAERNFFTDLLSPLSTPNKLQELPSGSNEKKNSSPWRGKIFGGSKSSHLEEKLILASNDSSQSQDRTISKSSAGAPPPVSWRDRYVMKFSGWRASTPDMGLPPSLTSPPSAALPPQQIVRGQVSLSPETEVASAASSQRSFHGSGRYSA